LKEENRKEEKSEPRRRKEREEIIIFTNRDNRFVKEIQPTAAMDFAWS